MKLRNATVDDAEDLVTLANKSYRGESGKRGWTTESDYLDGTRTDTADVEGIINRENSVVLVLCSDQGSIVGSVNVRKQGDSCYLGMLMVDPDSQGGGIGNQLMQAAERHAHEAWASKKMTMTVLSVRAELIHYYERRGYRLTGETKAFVPGKGVFGIPRVKDLQFAVLEKDLAV